jgi:transposase-like protein
MEDMIRKGRHDFSCLRTGPWVENLPRKYSNRQKAEMVRLRVEDKRPLADVALLYGTSDKYVSKLCRIALGDGYLRFKGDRADTESKSRP